MGVRPIKKILPTHTTTRQHPGPWNALFGLRRARAVRVDHPRKTRPSLTRTDAHTCRPRQIITRTLANHYNNSTITTCHPPNVTAHARIATRALSPQLPCDHTSTITTRPPLSHALRSAGREGMK